MTNPQTFFWPRAIKIPPLDPGEIHVWALDLDLPPSPPDWNVLDEEETQRARRFVFPRDRNRYVRAHSAVRTLLGSYTGSPPAEILFSNNAHGKPEIDWEQNSRQIRFNLSHSAGVGLLAAARGFDLGVDLEMVRPINQDVAEHHFSPDELLTLASLSTEEWILGFYRCWTSKEALLKGEGLGLNLPLDAFDVEANPRLAPALLNFRPPASLAPGWQLIELNPAHNAVGTLAAREETGRREASDIGNLIVRCFSFSG